MRIKTHKFHYEKRRIRTVYFVLFSLDLTGAHLVVQHILAHWQCGLRFWNTNIVTWSFWKENRKTCWLAVWREKQTCNKNGEELPEDPVDGGDGGDGGGVTHPLGEQLLPDLPSKHTCNKFYSLVTGHWSGSFSFITWAVRLQSDDPFHNWRSGHLLRKNSLDSSWNLIWWLLVLKGGENKF